MTFLLPGLVWLLNDNCNSPVDFFIPTLKVFFYIILALLIIFLVFGVLQILVFVYFYKISQTILLIYLFIKIILGIIMIVNVQKGYNGDWSTSTCPNLESLTLKWLILHYVIVIFQAVHVIVSFIRTLFSSDRSY